METPISIALTGDVMLGRLVDQVVSERGPAHPWGNVLPLLHQADLRIMNLECVIAASGRPWSRWQKVFHFRAAPIAIQTLELARADCVTLANNHVLDFEEEALLEMLGLLDESGITHTGTGRDLEEASRPALLQANGIRVGVVAFTDNEPGWAATPTRPGTNWIEVTLEDRSLAPVRKALAQAREMGADLMIFSIHWGPNMRQRPTSLFRRFAHAVIDLGADVFCGHSAHLFQGVEVYHGKPVIYDAGDFVDDYRVDPKLRNDRVLLFTLRAEGSTIHRIDLEPMAIDYCQVNRATGEEWDRIAEHITALSQEMGTQVCNEAGRLHIEVARE